MYQKLLNDWRENKDQESKEALCKFLDGDLFLDIPYAERNAGWITASKLKAFDENEIYAKYEYIDLQPPPVTEETDAMLIGTAVDDVLTRGEKYFEASYKVMAKRTDEDLGRVQITNSMYAKIKEAVREYRANPYFPQGIEKKTIIWLAYGKYPCKAELDFFNYGVEFGDLKTIANVDTAEPMRYYLTSMSFYFGGIMEEYMQKLPGRIFAVDKYTGYSRSEQWRFGVKTLEQNQGHINNLIQRWVSAAETGIYQVPDMTTKEGRMKMRASSYYLTCPFARAATPIEL